MELKESTLSILKNFASINPNIVIAEGNTLKTITEAKNVLATATVEESFPKTVGIYDLSEFLGVLSLVDVPKLEFNDDFAIVSDSSGRSKVKYFFSDIEMLTAPSKDITMPSEDVKFTLDAGTLSKLKRASSTLGHSEVSVKPVSEGIIELSIIDNQNATSNTFSIQVDGEYTEANFNFILNINNMKIIDGDYDVAISSKLISTFINKGVSIQYWIALEKSSTFGV
tara:strand:- start:45 stop:722 length:678 start_codon:yes stop_codon:yes gene_type:complete